MLLKVKFNTMKVMKFRHPISLQELFVPRLRLGKGQNNFVFKASTIWNKLQQYIFSKSESDSKGAIVPGFSTHSDLSISICMPR